MDVVEKGCPLGEVLAPLMRDRVREGGAGVMGEFP